MSVMIPKSHLFLYFGPGMRNTQLEGSAAENILVQFLYQFWTPNFYNNTITYLAFTIPESISEFRDVTIWTLMHICTYMINSYIYLHIHTHELTMKTYGVVDPTLPSHQPWPQSASSPEEWTFCTEWPFHRPELIGLELVSVEEEVEFSGPSLGLLKLARALSQVISNIWISKL